MDIPLRKAPTLQRVRIRKDIYLKKNKWQLKFHEYSMSQSLPAGEFSFELPAPCCEHIRLSDLANFVAPIRDCFVGGKNIIQNFFAIFGGRGILHFRLTCSRMCLCVCQDNQHPYEAVNWINFPVKRAEHPYRAWLPPPCVRGRLSDGLRMIIKT